MPIPELVPVIRTDAMDGLLRDLLPPRHGRATRHRASGFRASELFCNMGPGRRTARASSEPPPALLHPPSLQRDDDRPRPAARPPANPTPAPTRAPVPLAPPRT